MSKRLRAWVVFTQNGNALACSTFGEDGAKTSARFAVKATLGHLPSWGFLAKLGYKCVHMSESTAPKRKAVSHE